jgi:hypothetical protein
MTESAIAPHRPLEPVNLASAFDLALPLLARSGSMLAVLELAAHLTVEREESEDPDAYADPEFRRQEVKRRTLKGICDLRQIANMLELGWAIKNGDETWVDADGAEISLLEVIESQMPDEEQRKSSGRARQVWSFLDTAQAFREQGIPDERIAECAKSGLSSALGITAATQRKLEKVTPPDELKSRYEELIEAAAETTNLNTLKAKCRQMVDPSDTPPPPIPYSIENDEDETWYFVAKPSRDQIEGVILSRLGDMLELDRLLPESFVRYWRSFSVVPAGQ